MLKTMWYLHCETFMLRLGNAVIMSEIMSDHERGIASKKGLGPVLNEFSHIDSQNDVVLACL